MPSLLATHSKSIEMTPDKRHNRSVLAVNTSDPFCTNCLLSLPKILFTRGSSEAQLAVTFEVTIITDNKQKLG
jgi:hypothetical protein